GFNFSRNRILDRIEVKAGGQQYRKYVLNHTITSLGYELVSSITEYNELDENLPPINIGYDFSPDQFEKIPSPHTIYPGVDYQTTRIVTGEFDGDGKMDFITYNTNQRDKLDIFIDLYESPNFTISYEVNTITNFDEVFASSILSHNAKLLPQQGITTVTETINTSNSDVRFRTFALASYGPVFQYDKIYTFNIG